MEYSFFVEQMPQPEIKNKKNNKNLNFIISIPISKQQKYYHLCSDGHR